MQWRLGDEADWLTIEAQIEGGIGRPEPGLVPDPEGDSVGTIGKRGSTELGHGREHSIQVGLPAKICQVSRAAREFQTCTTKDYFGTVQQHALTLQRAGLDI